MDRATLQAFQLDLQETLSFLDRLLGQDKITQGALYQAYRGVYRLRVDSEFLSLQACNALAQKLWEPLVVAYEQKEPLADYERAVLATGTDLLLRRIEKLRAPLSPQEQTFV